MVFSRTLCCRSHCCLLSIETRRQEMRLHRVHNVSLCSLALALLMIGRPSSAFSPSRPAGLKQQPSTITPTTTTTTRLYGEDPDKQVTLQSVKKSISYDENSGRFYETDEECIPEDEYCMIDKETGNPIRLTVEEKERIFLDALQSYYVSGRQLLDDAEFDLLKEDLSWNGSTLVEMNRKEAKYLAAMQAYFKGSPILDDKEFDELKAELKEAGSKFAVSTEPKCYIDTGICTVTFQHDNFRNNLLYLPAGALLSLVWLGIGFELIDPIIRLNPILIFLLGSPLIAAGSRAITDGLVFQDNFVAYGPCPTCEVRNRVYFGNILGVEGFTDKAEVKCPNCKTQFSVLRSSLRASTVPKSE